MSKGTRSQMRAWALAMDLVYGVVAGGVVGFVLDRWVFGTTPWLTLALSLVMLVGGMWRFIRAANKLNRGFAADAKAGRFGTGSGWDDDEGESDADSDAC